MNPTDIFNRNIPFVLEGQVVKSDDPDQMGRVKIWVPALDGESFEIDSLPWAEYAPPFFGFTVDYPGGNDSSENASHASYGLWAVPKVGATVYIFCVGGDPMRRTYFAASIRLHRNRSLPAGRNVDKFGKIGPWGDAGDEDGNLLKIEPAFTNLRTQFQNKMSESESQTRGVFERQVAQSKQEKDGTEGYSKTPVKGESYLDSQTYCMVTPGRHALIFQDDPKHARVRVKTSEGHQIILDDANERIYVSTAKGKSWIELDIDGHVNIFGSDSISVRAGEDINFYADRDINLEAKRDVNIKAEDGSLKLTAESSIHLSSIGNSYFSACGSLNINSEKSLKLTSQNSMHVRSLTDLFLTADRGLDGKAGENMRLSASKIDLNGPSASPADKAECADQAEAPSVVPGHEPWKRPVSKIKRNKNWKA